MAKTLEELLPPIRVRDVILPLDATAEAARFEGEVRDAIIRGLGTNPEHRWEMVQVWAMCFLATKRGDSEVNLDDLPTELTDDELGYLARFIYDGDRRPALMGAILSELGARMVRDTCRVARIPSSTKEEAERLALIVDGCARHCPFDKRGDAHLHTLVRLLLTASEEASVGEQTPFDAMDRCYDKAASIRLVRPLFELMPATAVQKIDYTATNPSSLALVCGVIGEHLDDSHMDVLGMSDVVLCSHLSSFSILL